MSAELEQFCILFDRLVRRTINEVNAASECSLTWKPTVTSELRFGDRISDVTVKPLFIHLLVSEHPSIRALAVCDDGAHLQDASEPYSSEPELTSRLADGDYLVEATAMHADNMDILRNFSETTLVKKVTFNASSWTVMGFLWLTYSHHSYHFGHIDMFWRQSGAPVHDFQSFDHPEMA